VEEVPTEAQVLVSPYFADKVAGLVVKVVPSIVNEISLLNLLLSLQAQLPYPQNKVILVLVLLLELLPLLLKHGIG
jgi:hypothetical protein